MTVMRTKPTRTHRGWVAAVLAAAALGGTALTAAPALAAPAAAPAMRVAAASSRPPQQNVPVLEPGGEAQAVVFPPDRRTRDHPGSMTVQAPPHTRITRVDTRCYGMACPQTIAPDGSSATVKFTGSRWINSKPIDVYVRADRNAPAGTFHGSYTFDGQKQDLKVKIAPHPVVQVEGVTAVPGHMAVPKVMVTNTTGDHIGTRDVTLTLGPGGLHWMGWRSVYTPRNGGTEEFKCRPVPGNADKTLCKDVNLDLAPGESIELRTIVGTYDWLKPCEVPRVNFEVAGLGSGDANFVMKDENGMPPVCPSPV